MTDQQWQQVAVAAFSIVGSVTVISILASIFVWLRHDHEEPHR